MTYIIYYELVDGETVAQNLFIPACSLESTNLKPMLFQRELTPSLPNRAWAVVTSSSWNPDHVDEMRDATAQFGGISHVMRTALSRPNFVLRGFFALPLSDSEKLTLIGDTRRMPTSIQTKISAARSTENYPELPGRTS